MIIYSLYIFPHYPITVHLEDDNPLSVAHSKYLSVTLVLSLSLMHQIQPSNKA